MNKLLNIRQAAEFLNVNVDTLRNWERSGKLVPMRTVGQHRRYTESMLTDFIGIPKNEHIEIIEMIPVYATYARVSSHKQKMSGDLDRQSERLSSYVRNLGYEPEYEIKDTGSGLNDRRNGFNRLTELVINQKINVVVVENKDRLTRFQFNFIKKVFESYGCKIIVVNEKEQVSDEEELTIDMMSLLASFSGKYYSKRSRRNKKY